FSEHRIRTRFLRSAFYFGSALAVISTIQLFTSEGNVFWIFPSGYKDLVLGPFVYHNQFAAFVELVFPLAVVAALRDRRHALVYSAMAAALYASVIASASRAGARGARDDRSVERCRHGGVDERVAAVSQSRDHGEREDQLDEGGELVVIDEGTQDQVLVPAGENPEHVPFGGE